MKQDFKQFDVVLVDFGEEIIGSEQGGIRPAVIIQNNSGNWFSDTTIVMPLTHVLKKLNQPTHAYIGKNKKNGLNQNSVLLGECLRQVSENRIIQFLGTFSNDYERKEVKRVYDANIGM